ncbi:MAG: anaerobic ribonucleoside-triphosphate reductase activating protein [Firmicutes bacterium]|nr:anaerobic ribonucleoside-triphosphate reductase activating protein [Bacillota bacterium]
MNYAAIKYCDIANGTGVRTSLFVSGCTHRCKGCFNAVAWDFNYGDPFGEEEENRILASLAPEYVNGLSLLGGEPFEPQNQPALLQLCRKVRAEFPEKTIWCYTGYLMEEILAGRVGERQTALELLRCLDILVDGEFVEEKKNIRLKFRGSENQRIICVPQTLQQGRIVLWEER